MPFSELIFIFQKQVQVSEWDRVKAGVGKNNYLAPIPLNLISEGYLQSHLIKLFPRFKMKRLWEVKIHDLIFVVLSLFFFSSTSYQRLAILKRQVLCKSQTLANKHQNAKYQLPRARGNKYCNCFLQNAHLLECQPG